MIRPCTLGFISLAVSIFLWGSAYKLSLYHVHPDPSARASVARLWLETRNARAVTDVLRKGTPEWPPIAAGLSPDQHQVAEVDLGPQESELPKLPLLAPFVSLLPSRSPPMRRFCLA